MFIYDDDAKHNHIELIFNFTMFGCIEMDDEICYLIPFIDFN